MQKRMIRLVYQSRPTDMKYPSKRIILKLKFSMFDIQVSLPLKKKSTFIYSVQISEEKTVLSYNKPVPLPACGSYKPLTSTAVVIEEIAEEITQNSVVENSFNSTTNQTKSESTTPFPGRIREQT